MSQLEFKSGFLHRAYTRANPKEATHHIQPIHFLERPEGSDENLKIPLTV